jgi:hypothetical protein
VQLQGPSTSDASTLQPLTVTVKEGRRLTGWSNSEFYRQLAAGNIRAVKSGSKTMIVYQSLVDCIAALPPASFRAQKAV